MKSGTKLPPLDRLMAKVTQHPDGCWVWMGKISSYGYGRTCLPRQFPGGPNKEVFAHRLLYEMLVGPIPEGLELDHLCRNRACVNPEHLEAVTHAENCRRGAKAQQTHCVHGHEFTPENTYVRREGRRMCRACRNKRVATSHAKHRTSNCIECGTRVTVGPRCHPCAAKRMHGHVSTDT